jgi:hypothetical protein
MGMALPKFGLINLLLAAVLLPIPGVLGKLKNLVVTD